MKILHCALPALLLSLVPACGGGSFAAATDGSTDGTGVDAVSGDSAHPDARRGGGDGGRTDASAEGAVREAGKHDAVAADGGADSARDDSSALDSGGSDAGVGDAGSHDAGTDTRPADASANDATAVPTIVSTVPLAGATGVSIAKIVSATFSESMDPTTLTASTFTLQQGTTPVPGAVSYASASATASFVPTSPLALGALFTATITTGAKSTGETALASNYTWTFTTAACGQAPVALRSAAGFAVLAGSTVTNLGPTTVVGDLGVSPGTAVTGFPPGTVTGGAIQAGNPAAAQAQLDLTTAYNDAAGRTLCPVSVAGNLGGQTLTPGLYKSTSSLMVSSGNLTLDANGDPNAVFIFQTASTLDVTSGLQVVLSGGAKSSNVFWQVGTSATLGTTVIFEGTIMANQAISLGTGATLNGRALASIAAVTLLSNDVTKPAP